MWELVEARVVAAGLWGFGWDRCRKWCSVYELVEVMDSGVGGFGGFEWSCCR